MRRRRWILTLLLLLPSAIQAAEVPAVFEIPKLNNIKIDGDITDWRQGFRIEVLAPADGRIVSPADFDAIIGLAWTDGGLLAIVTVADDVLHESDDDDKLADGDSIEFILCFPTGPIRYTIAPGVDPKHKALRRQVDDRRQAPLNDQDKSVEPRAASRKSGAGYVVEAFLPTTPLRPFDAQVLGFQIIINDSDAPNQRKRHIWYPADDTFDHPQHAHAIHLGQQTSPPVQTAVAGVYENLRHSRVTVLTQATALGDRVEINDGPSLKEIAGSQVIKLPLALGNIDQINDRWGAYLNFPLPPLGRRPKPLAVYVDSKPVAQLTPLDIERRRRAALSNIDICFKPAVFSSDAFPRCDFVDPGYARDLIGGGYTLKASFFDGDCQSVGAPTKPGRYAAVVSIRTDEGVELPSRLVTLFKLKEPAAWRANEFDAKIELPPQSGIDPQVAREQKQTLADYAKDRFVQGLSFEPDAPLLFAALAESKPAGPLLAGRNSIWADDQRWWFPLKQKLGRERYRYLIDLPDIAPKDASRKLPLLLFLHGSGERGEDLDQVRTHGPPKLIADGKKFPFIVCSPQCPAGEWWSAQQLDRLLDEVIAEYPVDRDRIYLTGLSMGGYGVWELAAEYPQRFAAIVPICGAGSPQDAARLKDIPTWIFHGQRDPVVPFQRSVEMADALKKAGGTVKFTPDPNAGHDSWTAAYNDPELYEWLLRQKR
jgi:pimeloyl-ACP methyl ester carboxylesterase